VVENAVARHLELREGGGGTRSLDERRVIAVKEGGVKRLERGLKKAPGNMRPVGSLGKPSPINRKKSTTQRYGKNYEKIYAKRRGEKENWEKKKACQSAETVNCQQKEPYSHYAPTTSISGG